MDVYEGRGPQVSPFFGGERWNKTLSWLAQTGHFTYWEFSPAHPANGQILRSPLRRTYRQTSRLVGLNRITAHLPVNFGSAHRFSSPKEHRFGRAPRSQ